MKSNTLATPSAPRARFDRGFFLRDTARVARSLLGQLLVRRLPDGQRLSGLIVETEAYLGPEDRAAHTYNNRRTARNSSMWDQGGTCYVYFTYGMHHCMNIVTREPATPQAVLIRGLQPVEGLAAMRACRLAVRTDTGLCSGPAKLCQALQIDRQHDGVDLITGDQLWLEQTRIRSLPTRQIACGPRIGVAYAGDWAHQPLRFWVRDNPHVSRPRG